MLVISTAPLKPACLAWLVLSAPGRTVDLWLFPGDGVTILISEEEIVRRRIRICGDCMHQSLYSRKEDDGRIRWVAICEKFRKVILPQLPACDFYLKEISQKDGGDNK